MADEQSLPAQDGSASASTTQAAFGGGFVMPEELKKQYPDLADLITHSESMNDEERQYWVNILPIMTPDQIQNLRDILTNERTQLAAIDSKYQKDLQQVGQQEAVEKTTEERRARAQERTAAEQQAKADEGSSAEDLLKQIEGA